MSSGRALAEFEFFSSYLFVSGIKRMKLAKYRVKNSHCISGWDLHLKFHLFASKEICIHRTSESVRKRSHCWENTLNQFFSLVQDFSTVVHFQASTLLLSRLSTIRRSAERQKSKWRRQAPGGSTQSGRKKKRKKSISYASTHLITALYHFWPFSRANLYIVPLLFRGKKSNLWPFQFLICA